MIRTIKQRIYVVGLLPLAVLAVALVMFNGLSRIKEANQELKNAQNVTAALLQSPAVDALVVGNAGGFEQSVNDVIKTSPSLVCVTLSDTRHRMVSKVGKCDDATALDYFPITASTGGFSDFKDSPNVDSTIGELGLLMNDESVARKRRQVIFQLALSLIMIAGVVLFTGRLLRVRLIEPIERIGGAMHALSQHNYNARVSVEGEDEVTRLAEAINKTIATIAAYTDELERRRSDADRALHDADEANLALGGLVRSLTEDLEGPLGLMHSELTGIAIANNDSALRDRIKAVIALLQEAQNDFSDLIEIATSVQGAKQPPTRDLADIVSDIQRDIRLLSEAEGVSINFVVTQMPLADARLGEPTGVFLDLDGVRLKKALVFLIRAMARRCTQAGVYVNAELIKMSAEQLHVSVHLQAFYDPNTPPPAAPWMEGLNRYGNMPAIVGWTDRETKIIEYLLRAIGIAPTVSESPAGAVSVLLETTCHYTVKQAGRHISTEWMFATRPVSATLVSNDESLMRLTTRGDMSNHELKLMSFSRARANPSALRAEDALLIDMAEDIAEAHGVLDMLKAEAIALPMIAICPPGRMSDSLLNRLFEFGFSGTIQKPLHYSRVIEVIRTTLSQLLKAISRDRRLDQTGGS